MTALAPAPPHRLVLDRPGFYALVAAASLLLSLWAIYLDPVINSAGIGDVRAAQFFHDGEWRAGVEWADRPVYALLGAVLSRLTGMSAAYSLYALSAGLLALLTAGFVALVSGLRGGEGRAPLLAALLVLLFPALNGFRSHIIGDAGYWALYVWALAYFMHYAAAGDRRSLGAWTAAMLGAALFAVEALVFLVLVGAWRYARGRTVKLLVIAGGAAVVLVYGLWEQQWRAQVPVGQLLLQPGAQLVDGWHELERALRFKREALSGEFLDEYSRGYDNTALVTALLVLVVAGLVKGLGPVYTVLAGGTLAVLRRVLGDGQRYWWGFFAAVGVLLLVVPAVTGFAVSRRDAMIAALTLLAVVPPALDRLAASPPDAPRTRRWLLPLVLVAAIGSGLKGLDLRSGEMHLREAGLWLRATAPAASSLYSNSRIVVYYSGLYGYRPRAEYSWQEAMRMVQRDRWREFPYLALAISADNTHREGILMREIDIEPVKVFTSAEGDRVLIFDTRR